MAKWAILDVGLASDIVLQLHLALFHRGKTSSFETKVWKWKSFLKKDFGQNNGSTQEEAWKEKS